MSIQAKLRCVAMFWAVCCASVARTAEDFVPLRIVTFNSEYLSAPGVTPGEIQNYRFDPGRRQHLERVAHLIETLNPDIFNLVEVTSKEAVDQVVDGVGRTVDQAAGGVGQTVDGLTGALKPRSGG